MTDPLHSPSNQPHDHGPHTAFGLIFGPDYGTPVSTSCQHNEQQLMENDTPHGSTGSMHLLDDKDIFGQRNGEFVDSGVHHESNGGGHQMDEHNFFGQQDEQFVESDTRSKSSGGRITIDVNSSVRLVMPGESGEGLPFAPTDWPNPGDNWEWKVGRRPSGRKKQMFASKPALENYIRSAFPDADVDAFFASFTWKIPAKIQSPTKVEAAPLPLENSLEDETLKVQEGKVEENPRYGRRQRKQILPMSTEEAEEKKQKTPRSSQRKRKEDRKLDAPTSASTSKRKATRSSKRSVSHTANGEIVTEPEPVVNVIPEGFDNYLSSLEDILTQPLSEVSYPAATEAPLTESDMAKARSKLSSLLLVDFPTLVSSRSISKLTTLASKLRKDPTLSAEQLVKLKLIEEIPSFSKVFLECRQTIEQVYKFFGTLEANKAKVNSLRDEYNELKEKSDQLQSQVDSNLLTVQEIDNQIFQLQTWRAELTDTIENNKAARVEVASAQGIVANSIPNVVRDIQVANSKTGEWELKRTNAEKREAEILEKFAPLKGFSL
ncbi:DNA ligase [Salix suchowensis]|nr:DNA ligase [Salix suchowensis]